MEFIRATKEEIENLLDTFEVKLDTNDFWETAKDWGLTEEGQQDAYMTFSRLYLAYRRSMKHRGITLIKPTSHQWKILVEITDEARAFCKENDLEQGVGFRLFLDVAGQVTNSMKLHEIRAKADKIHEYFVALAIIEDDKNINITDRLFEAYEHRYLMSMGKESGIASDPQRFCYFVEAAVLCRQYKYRAEDYMGLMFNEFAWLGIPKPYHLVGDKAKELLKHGHDQKHGSSRVRRVSLKHIKDAKFRDQE